MPMNIWADSRRESAKDVDANLEALPLEADEKRSGSGDSGSGARGMMARGTIRGEHARRGGRKQANPMMSFYAAAIGVMFRCSGQQFGGSAAG